MSPATWPWLFATLFSAASGCGDAAVLPTDCPRGLERNTAGACVPVGDAGADGDTTPTTCAVSGLTISEVFADPDGEDAGKEFVELAGRPGMVLDGATLAVIGGDGSEVGRIALSGTIGANGLFVVGGDGAVVALSRPVPNAGGAVQVLGCDSAVQDAVAWGEVAAASSPGEGSTAPAAPSGRSLSRCHGAVDTNDNRADFGVAAPSPREINLDTSFADGSFCGGVRPCVVGEVGGLRIEEVLFNPLGTDDGNEFIEIAGAPGTLLDGIRLGGVNGDGGRELFTQIRLGGVIGDAGVFVVGGANVPDLDFPLGVLLQNGPDSITLLDCDGRTVIDAVGYGVFDADQVFAGEGASVTAVGEGRAASRCGDGDDTDDNGIDLGAATPTPGRVAAGSDFEDPSFCDGGGPGPDPDPDPACVVGSRAARINEALVNPAGPDAGHEFVEVQGAPGEEVDGLRLQALDGATGRPVWEVALEGTFGDDGLFVIGGEAIDGDQLLEPTIQNGPDSLVLLDCDGETVLDALGYGAFGEGQTFAGEGASAAFREGEALARCAGGTDTDDNAVDFGAAVPTPGAANADFVDTAFCGGVVDPDPPVCVPGRVAARISEVLYDPAGTDAGFEFVEIAGPAGASAAGLRVVSINGMGGVRVGAVTLTGVFHDDGLLVVGGDEVVGLDVPLPFMLQNGPDAVVLLDCDDETPLDALGYGAFGDGDVFAGEGRAAEAGSGESLARCPDGDDAGDNAADFGAAAPTPGAANAGFADEEFCGGVIDPDPPVCAPGRVTAVINEVLYNPSGADSGFEFIELAGPPGGSVEGARVVSINGSGGTRIGGVVLHGVFDGDGLLVIGGTEVVGFEVTLPFSLQNGPDSVVLLDCDDTTVIDALGYGSFGGADVFAGETRATTAPEGFSLARCPDDEDTDDNGADFGAAAATPGGPNDGFRDATFCGEPPVCEPVAPGSIVIHEVLYDPTGADAGLEFVELSAPAGFDVSRVRLVGINGANGLVYLGPVSMTGVTGEDGFYVVGGAMVPGVDALLPATIQNGPDSLALLACDDAVVDAVAYGTFADGTFAAGEGAPASGASEGRSLGRTAGADTGDNAADFTAQDPTPGT